MPFCRLPTLLELANPQHRKLPHWRYEEIKCKACDLLLDLHIDCFPIDPVAIAHRLGIKLRQYTELSPEAQLAASNASTDGFTLKNPYGAPIICYNDVMLKERIRFTIMHEVWHVILGHTEHSSLAEAEANFAAGYTLAPPPALHAYAMLGIDIDIMETCQLSHEASLNSQDRYRSWLRWHEGKGDEYRDIHDDNLELSFILHLLGADTEEREDIEKNTKA
ncbi:ImmA/IrrE family metallo-endopeptidase [Pseudoscardovia radai]|uniref:ImmA/IrrE family metallo-endopeptidase n=1 Tax=Pseudoscardovia radai TaxID=987066 RepID=UPI003992761E